MHKSSMGMAQLILKGRVFPDIDSVCFETFPESSSASEMSTDILFVFLSHGENP